MNDTIDQQTSLFYVDDDQDDLEFFEEAVCKLGQGVMLFQGAEELLSVIKNPPPTPSMVFLDLNMPNKNGFEVLQEIKGSENFKNFPLIIYSTATDSNTVDRCRKLGASLYVRKPTSLPALQQVLRQVLSIDWENFKPDAKNFVI